MNIISNYLIFKFNNYFILTWLYIVRCSYFILILNNLGSTENILVIHRFSQILGIILSNQ